MFTGIVETMGRVTRREEKSGALWLAIDLGAAVGGVRLGDSICVRGCCLTVEVLDGAVAGFHMMGETLRLTDFLSLHVSDAVNLERALKLGDHLGGHLVSGHVDGVGTVLDVTTTPEQTSVTIELPPQVERFTIPKGSITVDGVSLTLAALQKESATVCLIPHTLAVTTLGALKVGSKVHLEADQVGKWMARLLPQRD